MRRIIAGLAALLVSSAVLSSGDAEGGRRHRACCPSQPRCCAPQATCCAPRAACCAPQAACCAQQSASYAPFRGCSSTTVDCPSFFFIPVPFSSPPLYVYECNECDCEPGVFCGGANMVPHTYGTYLGLVPGADCHGFQCVGTNWVNNDGNPYDQYCVQSLNAREMICERCESRTYNGPGLWKAHPTHAGNIGLDKYVDPKAAVLNGIGEGYTAEIRPNFIFAKGKTPRYALIIVGYRKATKNPIFAVGFEQDGEPPADSFDRHEPAGKHETRLRDSHSREEQAGRH